MIHVYKRARLRRGKRPPWQRYIGVVLAYGLYWPVIKVMDWLGYWPRTMSRLMNRALGNFGAYRPTAHDVLICSYFKSGTNWTMHIAVQIAHRGHASFEHIHDLVAWPEVPPRLRLSIPVTDPSPWQSAPTGLRIIKTHLPFDKIPYAAEARYVCVVRDPKEVFVSSFHFVRDSLLGPLMPPKVQWLRNYLSTDTLFGSWAQHLNSYWQARHRDNVLFLTYQDMKRDLAGSVRKLAQFMNVNLSSDELAAVVQQATFSHMKAIGHKFDTTGFAPLWALPRGAMIRRGESGAYGELLSTEEQNVIDDYWRAELKRLGSDFEYDHAFGPDVSMSSMTSSS